ncbi:MAG TPA: EAL domain-containing protein [Methylophilaceae bacterium]|nr:EAL domain-containing protein [Methylophilaceae bacterium]
MRIALDGMGSGFNGLRTLASVRADFVKIDRAIVHEAQGSRVRTVLLEAIISMAQRLGCTIVAEGAGARGRYHLLPGPRAWLMPRAIILRTRSLSLQKR